MENILEFILSILFRPFKSKYEGFLRRIHCVPNKALKILLMILFIFIPVAFIFGLCCLCSY